MTRNGRCFRRQQASTQFCERGGAGLGSVSPLPLHGRHPFLTSFDARDTEKGALKCCLDHTKKHWSRKLDEGKHRSVCYQLHRFAANALGKGNSPSPGSHSDVYYYPDCNMVLCISCSDTFCTVKYFQVKDYVDILAT